MKKVLIALVACCLLCAVGTGVCAVKITLTDKGVSITGGAATDYLFENPVIITTDKREIKTNEARMDGEVLRLRYQQGTEAELRVQNQNTLTITFSNASTVQSFRMSMLLPFALNQGGKWRAGDREAVAFPMEQPKSPFLFQGNTASFGFVDMQGKGLSFSMPAWTYNQLQDNRTWNWKIFQWYVTCGLDKNNPKPSFAMTIADADTGNGQRVIACDRYGQNAKENFPGKVTSDAELQADIAADIAYYAGLNPPKWDTYGGLPGSGAKLGLKKTGFIHVEKKGNRWLMVDPEGNAFFHLGVCCVGSCDDYTWTKGRENIYEWLPSRTGEYATAFRPDSNGDISFYLTNLIRKYGKPYDRDEWGKNFIDRLRKWGFNSVGAFGAPAQQVMAAKQFPYVSSLPLGQYNAGMRELLLNGVRDIFDPYNPKTAGVLATLFAQSVTPRVNDPLLI
ncbi:MAG TPA: hypothetical protein VHV83_04325, partial [Armatimonadota bacterium]|nr:hypothetical protein [Armatimonadota bacterium]